MTQWRDKKGNDSVCGHFAPEFSGMSWRFSFPGEELTWQEVVHRKRCDFCSAHAVWRAADKAGAVIATVINKKKECQHLSFLIWLLLTVITSCLTTAHDLGDLTSIRSMLLLLLEELHTGAAPGKDPPPNNTIFGIYLPVWERKTQPACLFVCVAFGVCNVVYVTCLGLLPKALSSLLRVSLSHIFVYFGLQFILLFFWWMCVNKHKHYQKINMNSVSFYTFLGFTRWPRGLKLPLGLLCSETDPVWLIQTR